MIEQQDLVRLKHSIQGYPVGTEGIVYSVLDRYAFCVEIRDGEGYVVGYIQCFDDELELIG